MLLLRFGVVFLVCTSQTYARDCLHDHLWSQSAMTCTFPQVYQQYNSSSSLKGLRITTDFSLMNGCTSVGDTQSVVYEEGCFDHTCVWADLITEATLERARKVVEIAKTKLEKLLSIHRIQGELLLKKTNGVVPSCVAECVDTKIGFHDKDTLYRNTDLVIFITLRPVIEDTIGWSLPLVLDQFGRPIAGLLNLGARELQDASIDDSELIEVIVHELIHVLGFSRPLYKYFRNQSLDQVIHSTSSHTYLTTPNVIQAVETHFQCPTLLNEGAELDPMFATGTGSSHWSKRLFGNELMTQVVGDKASTKGVLSELTISLLKDTGWYHIYLAEDQDYNLPWGQYAGCSFVNAKSCSSWSNEYFCSHEQSYGCSSSKTWTTECNIQTYKMNLPQVFQHHADPKVGGPREYEYCSVMTPKKLCTEPTTLNKGRYGEEFASDSRCFQSSLYKGFGSNPVAGRCYEHKCTASGKLEVKLAGVWYECSSAGATITIAGYRGHFICPEADTYCKENRPQCDDSCTKNGRCLNGRCHCHPGWEGEKCQNQVCPGANFNPCSGHGQCNGKKATCLCENDWDGDTCDIHVIRKDGTINELENGMVSFNFNFVAEISWIYYRASLSSGKAIELRLQVPREMASYVALYAKFDAPPTLSSFDEFDTMSWMNRESTHVLRMFSTGTSSSSRSVYFGVHILDGRAAKVMSHISVKTWDIASKVCPPAEAICSGKGTCSVATGGNLVCDCKANFAGSECDKSIETLPTGTCISLSSAKDRLPKFFGITVDQRHTVDVSLSVPSSQLHLLARQDGDLPMMGSRKTLLARKDGTTKRQHILLEDGNWIISVSGEASDGTRLCVDSVPDEKCTHDKCSGAGGICECGSIWAGKCCEYLVGIPLAFESTHIIKLLGETNSGNFYHLDSGDYAVFQVWNTEKKLGVKVSSEVPSTKRALASTEASVFVGISEQVPRSLHDIVEHVPLNTVYQEVAFPVYYMVIYAADAAIGYTVSLVRVGKEDASKTSADKPDVNQGESNLMTLIISSAAGAVCVLVLSAFIAHRIRQRHEATGKGADQFVPIDPTTKPSIAGFDGRDHWCSAEDPNSGLTYYYNERTRETRWEPPQFINLDDQDAISPPVSPVVN